MKTISRCFNLCFISLLLITHIFSQENESAALLLPIHIQYPEINLQPGERVQVGITVKTQANTEIVLYSESHQNLVVLPNNLVLVPVGVGFSQDHTLEGLKEDLKIYDILTFDFGISKDGTPIAEGEFEVGPYSSAYRAQYSDFSGETNFAINAGNANTSGFAEKSNTSNSALTANHASMADFSMQADVLKVEEVKEYQDLLDPGNQIPFMNGNKTFGIEGRSFVEEAEKWGKYTPLGAESLEFTLDSYLHSIGNIQYRIPVLPSDDTSSSIQPLGFDIGRSLLFEKALNSAEEVVDIVRFTSGSSSPIPWYFGCEKPEKVYACNTFYSNNAYGFESAYEFILDESAESDTRAAFSASNFGGPFGAAFQGRSAGTFSYGQNGHVGVAEGDDSEGAGLVGYVGIDPKSYSYGILGDDLGYNNAWALYTNGKTFHSEPPTLGSDSRLKMNIRETTTILAKIMELNPVQYHYRPSKTYRTSDKLQNGFLAEEVESVFPELVSDVPVPKMLDYGEVLTIKGKTTIKGLNYTGLIPILTKGVQELSEELEKKEDRLLKQEKLIEDLITRIEQLEEKLK